MRTRSSATAPPAEYRSLGRERYKESNGISFLKRFHSDLKATGFSSQSEALKLSVLYRGNNAASVSGSEEMNLKYTVSPRVQLKKSATFRTDAKEKPLSLVSRSASDFNLHKLVQKPPIVEYRTASLRLDRRNKTKGFVTNLDGDGTQNKNKYGVEVVRRDWSIQQTLVEKLRQREQRENAAKEKQSPPKQLTDKFRIEEKLKYVLGECVDSHPLSKSHILGKKYTKRAKKRQQDLTCNPMSTSVITGVDGDKYDVDGRKHNRDWYCFNDRLVNPYQDNKRERCTSADARCTNWINECEEDWYGKPKLCGVGRNRSQRSSHKAPFRSKASEFWDTLGGYVDPESNESNLDVREVKVSLMKG